MLTCVCVDGIAGRMRVKRLPRPTSLATRTTPPCPSTKLFTMARPMPAPPYSRVDDESTW